MKYLVIKPFELDKKTLLPGDVVDIKKKVLADALTKNHFLKEQDAKDAPAEDGE